VTSEGDGASNEDRNNQDDGGDTGDEEGKRDRSDVIGKGGDDVQEKDDNT
jgi:hypothetical protein